MKSKRSLMTALVGLALLATPIAAAAKDHGRNAQYNAPRVSRSFNAPERNFNKHQYRSGQAFNWTPAPAFARHEGEGHEWKGRGWGGDGDEWRGRGWRGDRDEDEDEYENYGNRGYYGAPYVAAPYYGGGYAGSCRAAQSLVSNYWRDRNTGHPAAAASILRQNPWAFRSGCGGGSPYNNGGFFSGLGGYGGYGGAPVYGNYGGYNGYNGGYNGYNNGYNGGYGQPYGGTSMLAPLLQQFIR